MERLKIYKLQWKILTHVKSIKQQINVQHHQKLLRFIEALEKHRKKRFSKDCKIYGNCKKGNVFLLFIYLFNFFCSVESETLFVTAPYIYNVIFNNCWIEISSQFWVLKIQDRFVVMSSKSSLSWPYMVIKTSILLKPFSLNFPWKFVFSYLYPFLLILCSTI